MSIDDFGLRPHIRSLLDSSNADWTTVTLGDVHNGLTECVYHHRNKNLRDSKTPAAIERRKTLGRYIATLMRVKAAKWAERGKDALDDAILRTRESLGMTAAPDLYKERYLEYLIAEADKYQEKQRSPTV